MEKSKSDNTKFTLKACRVNKRLTLKEAADRLGISEFTLGNYESGKTFPTVPIIARIERLYGISYNKIIFFTMILRFKCKKCETRKRGEEMEEMKDRIKELQMAVKPLIEYMRKYETPMTTAIVTGAGIEIVSTEIHIPFEEDWS